jgi:hypothetical protein
MPALQASLGYSLILQFDKFYALKHKDSFVTCYKCFSVQEKGFQGFSPDYKPITLFMSFL